MTAILTDIRVPPAADHVAKWGKTITPGAVRDFSFSRACRSVMRKKRPVLPSVWAEKNRVLTTSVVNGPWRNEVTPYLVGVMDCLAWRSVTTVILCKAPQVGGTEAAHNFVGYALDHAPGPVMYVFPDKELASENSADRIQPMLSASPALRSYFTGVEDDRTRFRIKLRHAVIHMAWSHSTASLSNKPVRYLVLDEVDKYPPTSSKKEAGPIALARKRQNTYRAFGRAKEIMLSSTSTEDGNIWTALTREAEVVFDFHARCPACGRHQAMVFERIRWADECRDPALVEREKSARYACAYCDAMWTDHDRNRAVADGAWVSRATDDRPQVGLAACLRTYHPAKVGFHLPAWISPFISLSECAAAFLKGLNDRAALKDFRNGFAAEPWLEYEQERTEDALRLLADDRPAGLVPDDAGVLTAAVDVQQDGFWYEIRAWMPGFDRTSASVRHGFVLSWEGLREVLWQSDYITPSGICMPVRMTAIDTGYRTAEVYDFCRLNRGRTLPVKGRDHQAAPYSWTRIDTMPGTTRKIPGGLMLLTLDVTYYKNELAGKLAVSPSDPGAWLYHSEITEEWLRHMTAEVFDAAKGIWVCQGSRANHGWDCSVYNLACADVIGVRYMKPGDHAVDTSVPGEKRPRSEKPDGQADTPPARPAPPGNRALPSWYARR